jgi:uncharacterized protein
MRPNLDVPLVFVDTGAFAAFMNRNDEHHHEALTVSRKLATQQAQLITTNFIVAETHSLVLARRGRDLALATLARIDRTVEFIERIAMEDELQARVILERHDDKTYTYTDATSFAVMERLGLRDVFTFDRHFAQYGFSPLTV